MVIITINKDVRRIKNNKMEENNVVDEMDAYSIREEGDDEPHDPEEDSRLPQQVTCPECNCKRISLITIQASKMWELNLRCENCGLMFSTGLPSGLEQPIVDKKFKSYCG